MSAWPWTTWEPATGEAITICGGPVSIRTVSATVRPSGAGALAVTVCEPSPVTVTGAVYGWKPPPSTSTSR